MEPAEWHENVGIRLMGARVSRGWSVRRAAQTAGIDDALWRQLEKGSRTVGGTEVVANPRDDNLEAAARAVGLDPAEIFASIGRVYHERPIRLSASGADLDELSRLDPEAFDGIMNQARIALDRARDRRPR